MESRQSRIAEFWEWFRGIAGQFGDEPTQDEIDELFDRIQAVDDRIYFELSINTDTRELVFSAEGDAEAFPIADEIVASAPKMNGWEFIPLKPAMGFAFELANNGVVLNASELWFVPLTSQSNPQMLGLRLGVPNADRVLGEQSIDIALTILETGIGERSTCEDINHVEVAELPDDPTSAGYIELPNLANYITWHKNQR